MDNKKLYAFLKAAEAGSQAAAADALGYTPSAVSQLVSSLEKELGLTLLERSSKGVSVTAEGRGLIPLINDYLAHEQRI
jgi:DNA-binding transcriptional LysR family regulator